jgi:hypothetical protein
LLVKEKRLQKDNFNKKVGFFFLRVKKGPLKTKSLKIMKSKKKKFIWK